MASFAGKQQQNSLKTRSGDEIYLSQGNYYGSPTWAYVKIARTRLPLLLNAAKENAIDLAHFGEVIFSGWGKEPPASVRQMVSVLAH